MNKENKKSSNKALKDSKSIPMGTIIHDTEELHFEDSVQINPLDLFDFIKNKCKGSANYLQIAYRFKLISEDDFKIGVSLTSSERNKIRSAWKKLCGKNATKSPRAFSINGKGEKWVIKKNGKSEIFFFQKVLFEQKNFFSRGQFL